jgi:hypothetical protein
MDAINKIIDLITLYQSLLIKDLFLLVGILNTVLIVLVKSG